MLPISTVYQVCGFSVPLIDICKFMLQNPNHEISDSILNRNDDEEENLQKLINHLEKNSSDNIEDDDLQDYYNDLSFTSINYEHESDTYIRKYNNHSWYIFEVSHDAKRKYSKYKEEFIIGAVVATVNYSFTKEIDPDYIFPFVDDDKHLLPTKLINHPLNKNKSLKLFSIQNMCSCCT
jgi:hypothetical protein